MFRRDKRKTRQQKRRGFTWPRVVRRFRTAEDGATAIEFAMLGLPFFALLMAIIETALLFFAGQYLESSVDQVARMVRTGQLDETLTQAELRQEICDSASILFNCDALNIDMQVVARFADLGDRPAPEEGKLNPDAFGFTAAGPTEIVMLTVMSEWPIYTHYLQKYLSDLDSKNALLTTVAVFRTEPY